jgi:hypothetical protein
MAGREPTAGACPTPSRSAAASKLWLPVPVTHVYDLRSWIVDRRLPAGDVIRLWRRLFTLTERNRRWDFLASWVAIFASASA